MVIMATENLLPPYTVGELAEKFAVPVHRILYVVTSRRIDPIPRRLGGRWRLFDASACEQVRLGLEDTQVAPMNQNELEHQTA
jgi:hypothetical protein